MYFSIWNKYRFLNIIKYIFLFFWVGKVIWKLILRFLEKLCFFEFVILFLVSIGILIVKFFNRMYRFEFGIDFKKVLIVFIIFYRNVFFKIIVFYFISKFY